MVIPYALTCNRVVSPLGIRDIPSFSWKLRSDQRNQFQSAYRICAASSAGKLSMPDIYDSGYVRSDNTLDIPWNRAPLPSFRLVWWQVTVWDQDGVSAVSDPAWFETGVREADFHNASVYAGPAPDPAPEHTAFATTAPALDRPAMPGPPPEGEAGPTEGGPPVMPAKQEYYFRREFTVSGALQRGRLYLMASGPCLVRLNGGPAGLWCNDPSPNACSYRPLYTVYDLTEKLTVGENAVGISTSGANITVLLYLCYTDGTETVLRADKTWRWTCGPTKIAGESGETYDARLELPGWDTAGYNDAVWHAAEAASDPYTTPYPNLMPVQKVVSREHPLAWHKTPQGTWYGTSSVVSAGRVHFRLSAPAGTAIQIFMSEKPMVLGELQRITDPLGNPEEGGSDVFTYIFRGDGVEEWAQRYSYSGIGHLEILGFPGEIHAEDIWFESVLNDAPVISSMDCSEPMFTQLHEMLIRTIRNNFHGVLTTCPPYEKGPADGDTQVTLPAFVWNLDCMPILQRLDDDFAASIRQRVSYTEEDLRADKIAPGMIRTVPEWSCMLVSHCLELWDMAGLKEEAARYYPELQRYIQNELAELHYGNYVADSFFGGDWNSPDGNGAPEGGMLTGTCFSCRTLRQLGELSARLSRFSDAEYYLEEAEHVAESVNRNFFRGDHYETFKTGCFPQWGPPPWGRDDQEPLPVGYRQPSSVVPLALDLVPPEARDSVLNRLVSEIHRNGDHLDTGFLGAKYLLTTLSDNGFVDLAFEIAAKRDYPSWGYWLELGATTCWEHWGAFARSRDHYFLAAGLEDWFRETLGGIRDAKNGYAQFTVRPQIPEKLQHFSVSSDTVRGTVSSAWEKTSEGLVMTVTIPVGACADVCPPAKPGQRVLLDDMEISDSEIRLGSGTYRLVIQ